MAGRLFLGTSGYVYGHWRGVFYPPGLPPRDWLPFYAQQVPVAYNANASRNTRVVHLFENGHETANLDERIEHSEWWWGAKVAGDGVVTRLIPSSTGTRSFSNRSVCS